MLETPQTISARLLMGLLATLKEMSPDSEVPIDQGILILGMAEALGDLLTAISPEAQKALVPEILQAIVSRTPGGKLLVVTSDPPTAH
jgi:hypothetical protein